MEIAIKNLLIVNAAFTDFEAFSTDKESDVCGLVCSGMSETQLLRWRLMSKSALILKNWNAFMDNDEKCSLMISEYESNNWPHVELYSLRPQKILEFLTFIRLACDVRNKYTNDLKSSAVMQPMMQTYVESMPEEWLPANMRKTYLLYVKPYYTNSFACAAEDYGNPEDRPHMPKDVIKCFVKSFIYNPDKVYLNNNPPWIEQANDVIIKEDAGPIVLDD